MTNGNKKFTRREIEEIKKYKWIESEKARKDLGITAELEWVNKFAKIFREEYCKNELKTGIKYLDLAIKKEDNPKKRKMLLVVRRCMVESMVRRNGSNGKEKKN